MPDNDGKSGSKNVSVSAESLNEIRFARNSEKVPLSGTDAILRILVDQTLADRAKGLNNASLLTGYRGSPLSGIDTAYNRAHKLLRGYEIRFLNSVNEELAATSIWGSQLTSLMPDSRFDGVLGMWYGKAPGVDRAGDAFRHANLSGVHPKGGVLCMAGDDPECKSSTAPSASEVVLSDLNMPVLFPGTVQEVVDYGRYGYELSRLSGLWASCKIVTSVADSYSIAMVGVEHLTFSENIFEVDGRPWSHEPNTTLLPPGIHDIEREMMENKIAAAKWFVGENNIDRVVGAKDAWLGIVAAGSCYFDIRQALAALGVDNLEKSGVRIFKPGAIWPLDERRIREFSKGIEKILVVEEKRDLIESQILKILYPVSDKPQVLGKKDLDGKQLIPSWGGLNADVLMQPLANVLSEKTDISIPAEDKTGSSDFISRTPYFCSGCPHNRSNVTPEGSVTGGGIGCHTMSMLMPSRQSEGLTQMGGEGAQWVGAAPFVETKHRFQNLGDGTLFHSGSLAIRQAVAACTNITYKILYNDAVAMTGGQEAGGKIEIPELTRMLEAEGVSHIVLVSDDVYKHRRDAEWAHNLEIKDRSKLDEVQRELREIPGVTVLIYDQACAAELRRGRKRGVLPKPAEKIYINEDVCESCGDCSRVSNCLSLFNVDTAFGQKVQIHQESCNSDLTCMEGNCPSFVSVLPKARKFKSPALTKLDGKISEPKKKPASADILLVGIGGTGVVTLNQVLATAAWLEGKYSTCMDQTGLSQKGGSVVSHLKISDSDEEKSNRIIKGGADSILVFDLLTSLDNLDRAKAGHTVAVGSTGEIPTGAMVADRSLDFGSLANMREKINKHTHSDKNIFMNADEIASRMFQSQPAANVIVMGMAYQAGLLPVMSENVEKALKLNNVSVDVNISAFRLGRKLVADEKFAKEIQANNKQMKPRLPNLETLEDLVEHRANELIRYQNTGYANEYRGFVKKIQQHEVKLQGGKTELSKAVARNLHKLMAYKDEYEVARLYLARSFKSKISKNFGYGAKIRYHLQPPFMTKLGLKKKIIIPGYLARPAFRVLRAARFLRGTPMDIFGRSRERRMEQRLIGEYKELMDEVIDHLSDSSHDLAVEIAELPDQIRGYEGVKLESVEGYRRAVSEKLAQLKPVPLKLVRKSDAA